MIVLVVLLYAGTVFGGNYDYPQTLPHRQTMVHLFEWKWTDIAKECEDFLQHFGYGAVQVSPPQAHITLQKNGHRPWWIRYQPVSYQLVSRSGTREEFIDMVERCNNVGIRIIVDAVINHMTGANQKFGENGVGDTTDSYFDAYNHWEWFPDVPYSSTDFHDWFCTHDIDNDYNYDNVRKCRLSGLTDLNQSVQHVRNKIAAYFNDLFGMGVAGLRVDAAKHMHQDDMEAIYGMTWNFREDIFGTGAQPFIVEEVVEGGIVHANHYTDKCGRVTNFQYGQKVVAAVKQEDNFKWFGSFGESWFGGLDNDALNFIDNHDTQRHDKPLTYKAGGLYVKAVCFMLAWNYGYPRVMSSFYFSEFDQGPPNSQHPNYFTNSPTFSSEYMTCNPESGWVCEHRWAAIRNMALFRSVAAREPVQNIRTKEHGIAFSRGNKGFFAINNEGNTWNSNFQTGLPAGSYCNVISDMDTSTCSGTRINVDSQGYAQLSVPSYEMIALHVGAEKRRTVIFLKKQTSAGQDLFIRGGIGLDTQFGASKYCPENGGLLSTNECVMRIVHKTNVPTNFETYINWSQKDNYLDWWGKESEQGVYNGQPAEGTPMAWSTNDQGNAGYQSLNNYGSHYWILEFDIDCANTNNGWFEFKGYGSGGIGWENPDINQGSCSGYAGGSAPSSSQSSKNHLARCGYINVYEWGQSGCTIENF